MIVDKLDILKIRKEPTMYNQGQEDYIICDYCKSKIIMYKNRFKRVGGIAELPDSLTNKGIVKVALCNKCLKPAMREFERRK